VDEVMYTPKGDRLVSAGREGALKMSTLNEAREFVHVKSWMRLQGENNRLRAELHITKNSSFFATCRVSKLIVGKLSADTVITRDLSGDVETITCSAIGEHDSNIFVLGTNRGDVIGYNFKTKATFVQHRFCDRPILSVKMSSDGNRIVAATDSIIFLIHQQDDKAKNFVLKHSITDLPGPIKITGFVGDNLFVVSKTTMYAVSFSSPGDIIPFELGSKTIGFARVSGHHSGVATHPVSIQCILGGDVVQWLSFDPQIREFSKEYELTVGPESPALVSISPDPLDATRSTFAVGTTTGQVFICSRNQGGR